MLNTYDKYLMNEILPSVKDALMKEDRIFANRLNNSIYVKFYDDDTKGIMSYILTERTIQYVIFRELCSTYKIYPEDRVYGESMERLDLSIYKNVNNPTKFAEIGIELKFVSYTQNDHLYQKSLEKITADFDKIKRSGNKYKYLLLLGLNKKDKVDVELFNNYLLQVIDNRKFKKFGLQLIYQSSFRTDGYKDKNYLILNLLKLV